MRPFFFALAVLAAAVPVTPRLLNQFTGSTALAVLAAAVPVTPRLLNQFAGSTGLGATLGGGPLTGWGWGRAVATPLSPLAGSQANVYCNTSGDPPAPPKSLVFICTRQPAVAGGIIGDIIPRFGDPVCVNMCQPASPASGCIPCTAPEVVCAREYGGGGAGGVIYVAEAAGSSRTLCPTPGVDGGRVITGSVPLI